jgi:hypothetical protein
VVSLDRQFNRKETKMRKAPDKQPTLGSIRADAVYPKRTLCHALGWCQVSWIQATRKGLRTIRFGKQSFVLGADALDFFRRLADAQASGEGRE